MSKEPNGTLVMTTCKCRENTKNLVMTRTYFQEMLENKIAWGAKQEQERIISLLESTPFIWAGDWQLIQVSRDELIKQVKGETK